MLKWSNLLVKDLRNELGLMQLIHNRGLALGKMDAHVYYGGEQPIGKGCLQKKEDASTNKKDACA